MKNPMTEKSWSPYAGGIGIGILNWFAFAVAQQSLGISTAFERIAATRGKGDSAGGGSIKRLFCQEG